MKIVWTILVVLYIMFGALFPVLADEQIVEFNSSEAPPFWCTSLPDDGMGGEVLHAISKEIGVKSVIKISPLKRARRNLTSNHVGTPEMLAPQDFCAIIPIAVCRLAFFYYKPHHEKEMTYRGLDDIKGYALGVIRGALDDVSFFEKKGIKVVKLNSEDSMIKMLKNGRIDLCSMLKLSGIYTINKMFPDDAENFLNFEIKGTATPVTVMIDKYFPGGKELGEKYTNGLKMIIENGKYIEILEKYYGRGKIPHDWFMQLEKFNHIYKRPVLRVTDKAL
nr:transporter substrate-binding domain-containing protein [uncultured Desulfobacter sp.]